MIDAIQAVPGIAPCDRPEVVQDPRGLVYAVFLGEVAHDFDPRGLTVVQRADLTIGRHAIEAAIIGESHFVRVRDHRDRVLAVELFACVDAARCGGRPTRVEGYGDGRIDLRETVGAVQVETRVRTQVRLHTGQRGVPRPAAGEHGVVLAHCFAGRAAPRTLLGVRSAQRRDGLLHDDTRLRISSVHEYVLADRVAVITSDTTITIAEGA